MSSVRSLLAVLALILVPLSSASATAQMTSADEKELASYRLTMANVKKAMAAMQSLAEEAQKDPKVQERAKLEAQIKALQDKEELTAAQEAELEKLLEREAALEAEIERENDAKGGGGGSPKTLAEMEAQIKRFPGAAAALAREGLTVRDYARTMMALLQASMVEGFSQGKADLTKLPPGVNPENVRFVREHKEELAAMQAAMAGKVKK